MKIHDRFFIYRDHTQWIVRHRIVVTVEGRVVDVTLGRYCFNSGTWKACQRWVQTQLKAGVRAGSERLLTTRF